jgi:hypothetical protein
VRRSKGKSGDWGILAAGSRAVLAAGIAPSSKPGAIMPDSQHPQSDQHDSAPEIPFRTLLYRFMFFEWMFADISAARNLLERHAAWKHNRHMCRYLPVYLRRWSVLTACDFGLGMLFERALQASLLSAWFFTWSCVSLTGMVVISVAWLFLANSRMS